MNSLEDQLQFLYFLRNEIDGKIREFGGVGLDNESLDTINDMVQASFADIAMYLRSGNIESARDCAERWPNKNWLNV